MVNNKKRNDKSSQSSRVVDMSWAAKYLDDDWENKYSANGGYDTKANAHGQDEQPKNDGVVDMMSQTQEFKPVSTEETQELSDVLKIRDAVTDKTIASVSDAKEVRKAAQFYDMSENEPSDSVKIRDAASDKTIITVIGAREVHDAVMSMGLDEDLDDLAHIRDSRKSVGRRSSAVTDNVRAEAAEKNRHVSKRSSGAVSDVLHMQRSAAGADIMDGLEAGESPEAQQEDVAETTVISPVSVNIEPEDKTENAENIENAAIKDVSAQDDSSAGKVKKSGKIPGWMSGIKSRFARYGNKNTKETKDLTDTKDSPETIKITDAEDTSADIVADQPLIEPEDFINISENPVKEDVSKTIVAGSIANTGFLKDLIKSGSDSSKSRSSGKRSKSKRAETRQNNTGHNRSYENRTVRDDYYSDRYYDDEYYDRPGRDYYDDYYVPVKSPLRFIPLVLVIAICVLAFISARVICFDEPVNASDYSKVSYTVYEGLTDSVLAQDLLDLGLIDNSLVFRLRCIFYDADYVPGTYELSPCYSTEKIINIVSGYKYGNEE